MVKELSDSVTRNPNIAKDFERKSLEKTSYDNGVRCVVCYASPKPEFFLFSLFIFSFISQLI